MILEQCKGVNCVDLGESFQTHIFLQNLASIQPRTIPLKFAASRDGLAWVSGADPGQAGHVAVEPDPGVPQQHALRPGHLSSTNVSAGKTRTWGGITKSNDAFFSRKFEAVIAGTYYILQFPCTRHYQAEFAIAY